MARRYPWAFLSAVLILLGVELAVRCLDAARLTPYQLGEQEYFAVKRTTEVMGVADVFVVGSSRAREGISAPVLAEVLARDIGRPLTVANYACAGSTAEESEAVLDYLLRQKPHPALVIYGLEPRQLWGMELEFDRASLFWSFGDWWQAFRQHGCQVLPSLPNVIRNFLERHYRTFAYRKKVVQAIDEWMTGEGPWPNPVAGQKTEWHARIPERSMLGAQIDEKRVRWYVGNLLRDGIYPMGDAKVRKVAAILERCQSAGVPVLLVEMPLADILHRIKPPDVFPRLHQIVGALAERYQVPWVPVERLGVGFEDGDFLDQSHLNFRGARKLTEALAGRYVVPLLKGP